MKYSFYSPHPGGVAGCDEPLPGAVLRVVNGIAGTQMTLAQARLKICKVVNENEGFQIPEATMLTEGWGTIHLQQKVQSGTHVVTNSWCLLFFVRAEEIEPAAAKDEFICHCGKKARCRKCRALVCFDHQKYHQGVSLIAWEELCSDCCDKAP